MKYILALIAWLFASLAVAQQPKPVQAPTAASPAPVPVQLGVSNATPPVLYVLDPSRTWAPLGSLDPNLHLFYPALGAGKGGAGKVSFATHAQLLASAPIASFSTGPIEQQGYNYAGDGGWATYDWCTGSCRKALAAPDGIFVILPQGQSAGTAGRFVMRIPSEGVHPEAAGASCSTPVGGAVVNDDATAIQNLANYLSNNQSGLGTIILDTQQTNTTCVLNSVPPGNPAGTALNLPWGVVLKGVGGRSFNNIGLNTIGDVASLQLNPSYFINMGNSTTLENLLVWRAGLSPNPANMEAMFNYQFVSLKDGSVAIKDDGGRDARISHVAVIGFAKGLYVANARVVIDDYIADAGTALEMTSTYDASLVSHVRTQTVYSGNFVDVSTYAATVPSGGGGRGYRVGDLLTVPSGATACKTNPVLRVASIGTGGAVATYEVDNQNGSDTGDCPARTAPETFGITTLPVVFGGSSGSGGTPGTNVPLTVQGGTCSVRPVLLGAISGSGALSAITGIQTPGACPAMTRPNLYANVTGGGLAGNGANITGAFVLNPNGVWATRDYWSKNPIYPTGGHGANAQAIISIVNPFYRPGTGAYIHERCDGCLFSDMEFEGNQTSLKVQNVAFAKFRSVGGENFDQTYNIPSYGLDVEGCVHDVSFFQLEFEGDGAGYLLNNKSSGCLAGASAGGVVLAELGMGGGNTVTGAPGNQSVVTGPGSWGTIIAPRLSGGYIGSPPFIQIGANSGQWAIDDIHGESSPGAPIAPAYWLGVSSSAMPPVTNGQYGWGGLGSLVVNGDMALDQPFEGALAPDGAGLRIDRWRMTENIAGESLTSQQRQGGPSNGNSAYNYPQYLRIASNAAASAAPAQSAYLSNSIEGGPWMGMAMFGTSAANQIEVDFCARASLPGTYDLVLWNGAKTWSYIHPVALAANSWLCSAFDTQSPPKAFGAANVGSVGLTIGFDLGAGTNYQTTSADQWVPGEFHELTGHTQLAAARSQTLDVTAVHVRPVAFQTMYTPRDIGTELQMAQRFYQKSFSAGVRPAGNQGTGGAAGLVAVANWRSAVMSRITPPMIAPPVVTFFSTGAATGNCYDVTKAADIGAASASMIGAASFLISCAAAGGNPAAGDTVGVQWSADSGF